MKITILTLFPDFFTSPLESSMLKRAQNKETVEFSIINIRDFTTDKHQVTDDRPFGGGAGMVLKVEPIFNALDSLNLLETEGPNKGKRKKNDAKLVLLTSAKGPAFTQEKARSFAQYQEVIIICGHYEGVDERVAQNIIDSEIRIGEYVLTGGEPAAIVLADAISRLVPGVLGNESSLVGESHDEPGLLAYPQYTRPEVFNDWATPPVLLGGNHAAIAEWRSKNRG